MRTSPAVGVVCPSSLLLLVILPILAPMAFAQNPYMSSAQTLTGESMMPSPGGHDYLHLLAETVSPSNGSVTYDIDYPMPKGRGMSFPYRFGYSTAGLYRLMFQYPNNDLSWQPSYINFNGSIPVAMYAVTTNPSVSFQCGPPGTTLCQTWPCNYATGFTFYGPDGTTHNIGIGAFAPQGTPPPNGYYGPCATPGSGTAVPGTDGEVSAEFTNPSDTINKMSQGNGPGTFAVTDKNGTTYFFGGGIPIILFNNLAVEAPYKIEDRNGNLVTNNASWQDTLGRSIFGGSVVGGINYPAATPPPGAPASVTVTYTVPNSTSTAPCFNGTVNATNVNGSQRSWSGVALPDGTQYTFFYGSYNPNDASVQNSYGLLNEVVFPGGGWIKYTYSIDSSIASDMASFPSLGTQLGNVTYPCNIGYSVPRLAHRYVSYDGVTASQQQDFTYTTTWNSSGFTGFFSAKDWTSKTTKVVTTDNIIGKSAQTIYTYVPGYSPGVSNPFGGDPSISQVAVEQSIQYYDWGNTASPLKTVTKTFDNIYKLTCEATTLNGLTAAKTYAYMAPLGPFVSNYVTDEKEYDLSGASPTSICNATAGLTPLRETATTYQQFHVPVAIAPVGGNNQGAVFYKAQTVIAKDGAGNRVAETDYAYDGSAVGAAPGIVQHDDTNYGTAQTARGNGTTATRQCFVGSTNCTNSVSTFAYDQTGQITSRVDPCGNTTCGDMSGTNHTITFSYADNPSPCTGSGNAAGASNAYLTHVVFPQTGSVAHQETLCYNYVFGDLTTVLDENNQTTSYLYNDPLDRLTETDLPDGGKTTIAYSGATSVTTTQLISGSLQKTSVATMDGMFHTIQAQLTSDPSGADITDTGYDGMGRARTQSNPHRTGASSTDGTTTTNYDAIGRVLSVVRQDGSTATTSYSANCTTVTDEASKSRKSCSDGLGRLTQVLEDPSTLNYETDYSYSTLGNLLTVNQKGNAPTDSSQWRTRTFTYDSLSRLLTANNPETGTLCYGIWTSGNCVSGYDVNGNLSKKTDARNITITFSYDVLNRLAGKSYSNGDTAVTATYDAGSNGIGRRTGMTDASGSNIWTYDVMGRVSSETRSIGSASKTIRSLYNLDGSVQQVTYPSASGTILAYTYNTAGHLTMVKDTAHNITYLQSTSYAPPGELAQATYGSVKETSLFNNRLQPCWFYATTGTALATTTLCTGTASAANVLDLKYNFNWGASDNGDVKGFTNDKDSNRSVAYTYDALNRLATAATPNTDCSLVTGTSLTKNWGESFTIDAWGNLTGKTPTKCSAEALSVGPATVLNRLPSASGFGYDAAGDMTSNGAASYTYNAEGQLATAAVVTYTYDGDGNRVKKSNGTEYWGAGPMLESDTSGTLQREFIYAGGKRIACRDISGGAVYYYVTDDLGSSSVVTTAAGAIDNESDYYPYGGERANTTTLANQNYKFTGKERDAESGLDNFEARYLGSSLGRFMSPDPMGGTTEDPQSLNRYAYVRNNPLTLTDPTGMNFGLPCSGDNTATCNNGLQGSWQTDKDGTKSFVNVSIGNKDGQLQDVSVNNTGTYTASFDGSNVSLTNSAGSTQNGSWLQGTDPVKGVSGGGDLSNKFSFDFYDHGPGQKLNATFTYAGKFSDAQSELYKAGYSFSARDQLFNFREMYANPNAENYRTPGDPGTGANSGHFLVNHSIVSLLPQYSVPTTGSVHTGETNPTTSFKALFQHLANEQ